MRLHNLPQNIRLCPIGVKATKKIGERKKAQPSKNTFAAREGEKTEGGREDGGTDGELYNLITWIG